MALAAASSPRAFSAWKACSTLAYCRPPWKTAHGNQLLSASHRPVSEPMVSSSSEAPHSAALRRRAITSACTDIVRSAASRSLCLDADLDEWAAEREHIRLHGAQKKKRLEERIRP